MTFFLPLKFSVTVAGTTAGQEGGEAAGEGLPLRTGLPAHRQAPQQDAGLQAAHTTLGQEGLPKALPSLPALPPLSPSFSIDGFIY